MPHPVKTDQRVCPFLNASPLPPPLFPPVQSHALKTSGYGAVDLGNPSRGYRVAEGRGWAHIHGWLMAVCWGVLIPLGAIVARNFKDLQVVL